MGWLNMVGVIKYNDLGGGGFVDLIIFGIFIIYI